MWPEAGLFWGGRWGLAGEYRTSSHGAGLGARWGFNAHRNTMLRQAAPTLRGLRLP